MHYILFCYWGYGQNHDPHHFLLFIICDSILSFDNLLRSLFSLGSFNGLETTQVYPRYYITLALLQSQESFIRLNFFKCAFTFSNFLRMYFPCL